MNKTQDVWELLDLENEQGIERKTGSEKQEKNKPKIEVEKPPEIEENNIPAWLIVANIIAFIIALTLTIYSYGELFK